MTLANLACDSPVAARTSFTLMASTWNRREGARSPRVISPICSMLSASCSNRFLSIAHPSTLALSLRRPANFPKPTGFLDDLTGTWVGPQEPLESSVFLVCQQVMQQPGENMGFYEDHGRVVRQ